MDVWHCNIMFTNPVHLGVQLKFMDISIQANGIKIAKVLSYFIK